jgi:hypothetical protein
LNLNGSAVDEFRLEPDGAPELAGFAGTLSQSPHWALKSKWMQQAEVGAGLVPLHSAVTRHEGISIEPCLYD